MPLLWTLWFQSHAGVSSTLQLLQSSKERVIRYERTEKKKKSVTVLIADPDAYQSGGGGFRSGQLPEVYNHIYGLRKRQEPCEERACSTAHHLNS